MKRLVTLALGYLMSGFMWVAPANANIVTNGGFETGNFAGWTLGGGDPSPSYVGSPPPSGYAYSGTYFAFLTTDQGVTIAQDLTTVPGANYLVEFMLRYVGRDPAVQGDFAAKWASGSPFLIGQFPAYGAYGHYQFVATATTGSSRLTLGGVTGIKSAFLLDDVSVSLIQVPTPATIALLGLGLVGICVTRRKRA
jgi:hypothetical protein